MRAGFLSAVKRAPRPFAMGAKTLWQTLCLALLFSVAIFMHILSCALYDNWWPMLTLIAYVLAPIPLCCYARASGGDSLFSESKALQHWAVVMT